MVFRISIDELERLAEQFWTKVKDSKVFALHGKMGAGKTTIINTLCRYKGTKDVTSSPTFSIVNEYSYIENGKNKKIFHIDLYRLKDEEEVVQAGIEDCIYSGSIYMVEWPEKAPDLFDDNTVHIFIEAISETEREIDVRQVEESKN